MTRKFWFKRAIDVAATSAIIAALLQPAFGARTGNAPETGTVRSFGGPDGVSSQVKETYEGKESAFAPDALKRGLTPYRAWKQRLKEEHGFTIGFNAYWLYQHASTSLGSDDDAWGQIYRLQGNWTMLGRKTGHPGGIEWRIEHRSNIGSNLAPSELGSQVGIAALNTGFGYSPDFETDLAVFNWKQLFNKQTAGVAAGRMAFDVYLDAFAFQTISRGFLNRSFLLNPTVATTGIGALGAVAKGFVSKQVWIGGQIYDGNAASGKFDMDTFGEGEWLKAAEIGWTPSVDRRKTDRIQLTYWDKDARNKAGVPSGKGWAVSTSWKVDEKLLPFLRFGHSDGGAGVAAENAASVGLEYMTHPDQALSVGFGWAEPVSPAAGPTSRDEYVLEASYKFQLLRGFSLLPDLQYIKDPANNPSEDGAWVIGLRGILTF